MAEKKITYEVIARLRAAGWKYREISEKFKVSTNTVGICLRMGKHREDRIKTKKLEKINRKITLGILREIENGGHGVVG